MPVPAYDNLFNPLLTALHQLGSSASIEEQEQKVAEVLDLSEAQQEEPHGENNTKFSYNLAWARTYLKNFGLIDNSSRGVWALTPAGQRTTEVDKQLVKKTVREKGRKNCENEHDKISDNGPEEQDWELELLGAVKKMPPEAFERLCQRVLRESGFIQVEVTGKSADGGIDGRGVVNSDQSSHSMFTFNASDSRTRFHLQ